ncbi:MAG TPA: ATP-binding cassette domain-containing protein [Candidatus Eremiobacteraceae bacterium]|nr:ATP-binding cassette domain-containing protein [Candidatus Eremiobacteraceae bacterium]
MSAMRSAGLEPKLAVADLRVSRENLEVLRSVSFSLPAATSLSFIGAAGSGKSVLLRALCRLLELDPLWRFSGSVILDGEEILSSSADVARVRRRLGLVFPSPALLPMSVFDNVVFGLRAMGVRSERALEEAYERAMRRVLLWEPLGARPKKLPESLPHEMRQRICIARAIALEPEALLLDEPAAGLDPVATQVLEDVLIRLRRECTLIVATNNLQQAARLSDVTCYLARGEVVEIGDTPSLFSRPSDPRTEDFLAGRID